MPACWLCGRRLRVPSPDGLGPRCRRKLQPVADRRAARAGPTDGQLPLPLPERPHLPPIIRGRHVTDIRTDLT